jgi:hypothetical protein
VPRAACCMLRACVLRACVLHVTCAMLLVDLFCDVASDEKTREAEPSGRSLFWRPVL